MKMKLILSFLAFLFLVNLSVFAESEYFDGPRIKIKDAPMRGNPKAPVTIIEFSDFQCPMCGLVQPTIQTLRKNYPDQVRFVFKHFPLQMHSDARTAHLASSCAEEQGKFWEYRDYLFEHQQALKKDNLIDYAKSLDLNEKAFTQCLDENRYGDKVEADYQEGIRFGVHGTPAFVINRQVLDGAYPYPAFEQAIKEELNRKD